MLITRANPLGGNPIKDGNFPLHGDNKGAFGLLLGYVPKDSYPGDKILIRLCDADDFAAKFLTGSEEYKQMFKSYKPKKTLRQRVIEILGGNVVEN